MQIDAGDKQAGQAYVTKAWRMAEGDWQPDGIGAQLWWRLQTGWELLVESFSLPGDTAESFRPLGRRCSKPAPAAKPPHKRPPPPPALLPQPHPWATLPARL